VRLAQENQALQVQLEAMRAAPAPLAAAQAARDEAAADRANWQHHIQKYQVGWHDHLAVGHSGNTIRSFSTLLAGPSEILHMAGFHDIKIHRCHTEVFRSPLTRIASDVALVQLSGAQTWQLHDAVIRNVCRQTMHVLLQERRESQRQKDADWQAQVASLQSRVAAAQEVNAELRQRVAEQPYTAEEAARMSADK